LNPELKFHSIVISVTTLIVFFVWVKLTDLISNHPFTSIFASGLISLGIYRSIAVLFLSLFQKISQVKKWILGPYYMEGTWVGFFVGHENKIRFISETLKQDFRELIIRGKAFKEEDGKYHGSWVSDSVNINVKSGLLTYTYEANIIDNTFINPGLARFSLERSSKDGHPTCMIGFSSDLFNRAKLKANEEKISDKTDIRIDEALKKAKEIYEKNIGHI